MFDERTLLLRKIHRPLTLVDNASSTLAALVPHSEATIVGQMPVLARLREFRVRAGLTQIDLADKARVSRGTIIRLEAGDPNGRPTTLTRLARALSTRDRRVTIDDLIGDVP